MTLLLTSLAGAVLFAWPLLGFASPPALPALAALCAVLAIMVAVETGARRLDSRGLALLAAIAAVDAALRLALVNGIAGFSPVFFLILCAGYVFGTSFGFLCGATALLVSALVTGGVGPWLPYEMFAAAWCGVVAGALGARRRGAGIGRADIAVLAAAGVLTGFGYGAVMDIWDWSLRSGAPGIGWMPGLPIGAELGRFGHFYLVTSLVWDAFRAGGNALLVVVAARPVLLALSRLRRRFSVIVETTDAVAA